MKLNAIFNDGVTNGSTKFRRDLIMSAICGPFSIEYLKMRVLMGVSGPGTFNLELTQEYFIGGLKTSELNDLSLP